MLIKNKSEWGQEFSVAAQHLPGKHKIISSIPGNKKTKQKNPNSQDSSGILF